MIIEHKEDVSSDFEGTIIDIETIGEFCNYPDSRRYKSIQLVILGFIHKHGCRIFCARGEDAIEELKEKTKALIDSLERPLYAFNSEFERSVLFYELGRRVDFGGELQQGRESKANACSEMGIPNYDDPFYDKGFLCMKAWQNGEFDKAMAHNRACLLKERDILIQRGFGKPNKLIFVAEK
ncbi:MAG: hypothetical protein HY530_08530 [Chloroflexi bacterium]|nr:hypothetical protein [Chloroflexota bacterium]